MTTLTKQQVRALKTLSMSFDRFEPLELRASVRHDAAEELVRLGWAETGECYSGYAQWGYPTGYRLTSAGRRVLLEWQRR